MSILIAKQHRLPSLAWLLLQLRNQEKFTHIWLTTKHYSDIPFEFPPFDGRVSEMSSDTEALESLPPAGGGLVLDEGGGLHEKVANRYSGVCAGVEQTTAGMRDEWRYPVVLVCRSSAKLLFESQIIARGILRKLDSLNAIEGKVVGIIGLGAVGSNLARALLERGISVIGHDRQRIPTDLSVIEAPLNELVHRSDLILGCTGTDVFSRQPFPVGSGRKLLASCTSSNIEFWSLFGQIGHDGGYGIAHGQVNGFSVSVLNGGFPINFDRTREWELFDEIILTRKLVLAGLDQACGLVGSEPRPVMLNPAKQLEIVLDWLEHVPDRGALRIPKQLDESFFRTHSEGRHEFSPNAYTLHVTTPEALARMRSHNTPYETDVCGISVLVLPNVWSPAYDWSSAFYIENLPQVRELDCLEIGCGSGVISTWIGLKGARRIEAVDINPDAVKNTRMNFARHDIKNGRAFVSDGFSSVRGKFDVIVWNAPFHGSRAADLLERGCADEGYKDVREFFIRVPKFLKSGGRVVLGFSESGDLNLVRRLVRYCGLRVLRELSDWRDGYNCVMLELSFDIRPALPTLDAIA